MANTIEVTVSAKDATSAGFGSATKTSKEYGKSLDRVGDSADRGEQKILGAKDAVDGVATVMKGPGEQGMAAYLQGWADIASGIANFAIPALQAVYRHVVVNAAKFTWAAIKMVASWVWMGVQALFNAGRIALAWVIALGPIGWAIATLALLGTAFVILWTKCETFRNIVKTALGAVGDAAKWLWEKAIKPAFDAISTAFSAVVKWFKDVPGKITGAFKTAGTWLLDKGKAIIGGLWNGIKAVFENVKSWFTRVSGTILLKIGRAELWLVQKGKDIIGGLWNGLKAIWEDVKGWFGRLGTSALNNVALGATTLVQKGKDLLNGLWTGIKSVWETVKSWFKDVPKHILAALGIHSPPDWAIDAGKHIMGGLLKGMGLNKQKVIDFTKSIAASFGPGLAGKGLPGYTGRGPQVSTNLGVEQLVQSLAASDYGWTGSQWTALRALLMGESGFDPNAQNPTSTAYGIFQFLNSTWASVGARKSALPYDQTVAGLKYIAQKYGNPVNAFSAWLNRSPHWYGKGGLISEPVMGVGLRSGDSYGFGESGPEMVTPLGAGGAAHVVLEINSGGSKLDDAIVEIIRKAVRVRGGNVQVVLGR